MRRSMSAFTLYFYPRPPRGGRRLLLRSYLAFCLFLSTPSARRATASFTRVCASVAISIHALREEGDRRQIAQMNLLFISIHALREEGDT